LKVASSVGLLWLPRQVLFHHERKEHFLPANALLPEHAGMLLTRRLQEWACLLGSDVAFPVAQRLLGWKAGEEKLLCPKEVQRLVCRHGQILRAAAEREVDDLLARPDLSGLTPQLAPTAPPRRPAAWAGVLEAAVATALEQEQTTPPEGVTHADWERVLAVRRAEGGTHDLRQLARLGPEIAAEQVVVSADEVLVRRPAKKQFDELRTGYVAMRGGHRYLCGQGSFFLLQLWLLILLCGGRQGQVTFLCDGGRWLREFAREQLSRLPRCEVILDWYHLWKKVKDRISRMGGSKTEKQALQKALLRELWKGCLPAALDVLNAYRGTAKNLAALEELVGYLGERAAALPNYRERRAQQQYIGSGQAEKTNDLVVARRQKNRGMHWNINTSEALARLKCLQLNHEWDAYWSVGRLPSLVAG
jgi:hypothetical protein